MSSVVPGCDSDEEVFWGPVTARELEIIWRHRMANKKEEDRNEDVNPVHGFMKKAEVFKKSSDQNVFSTSSISSVQEVPSLQDFRNLSCNQKRSSEVNDHEHFTEDSEHEKSVENESALPFLEASMVINQNQTEIQTVNNSSGNNCNNDNFSDQKILHKHEGHLNSEPESSNQPDSAIQITGELSIQKIDAESVEGKMNSAVDNLNEISHEKTKLYQLSGIDLKRRIDASKDYCNFTGEEVKTSDPSHSIKSNLDNCSSHGLNIEVPCSMSHDLTNHQEVSSVDVINNVRSECVTSVSESVESSVCEVNTSLNQSNIGNIPPEELSYKSAEQNLELNNLDYVAENIDPSRKPNESSELENVKSINSAPPADPSESSNSKIKTELNQLNIENIPPEKTSYKSAEYNLESSNFDEIAENIDPSRKINDTSESETVKSINSAPLDQSQPSCSKINIALNQSNIENIPPQELCNMSIEPKVEPHNSNDEENIDNFRKTSRLNGDSVLQELQIANQDDSKINDSCINESSDEKSFVSLNSEEDKFISSSSTQCSSNQDCPEPLTIKNKENEDPLSVQSDKDSVKSKIPVSGHIKPILKPARLQPTSPIANEKWLNDLKQKKIPKVKKPDYMVSPAKLGNILKKRNQPMAGANSQLKRPMQPKITSSTPMSIPGSSKSLVTPKKKQFEYVRSPISAYIRTGTGIPSAKSLPVLQSPNKIPVPVTVKQTTVQKLTPKFYASAEKLVVKPGCSSSIPKPAENKTFLTPKIFKHQGRVADLKKPGDINVVTPRAVRKTNLSETSFACLPHSSNQLNVSVLEEL